VIWGAYDVVKGEKALNANDDSSSRESAERRRRQKPSGQPSFSDQKTVGPAGETVIETTRAFAEPLEESSLIKLWRGTLPGQKLETLNPGNTIRPLDSQLQIAVGIPGQNFRRLEAIGKGGMGVVYRAQQDNLKREVAIKTLLPGATGRNERLAFLSETYVTAWLDHPNIVPIYDMNVSPQGEISLAMKLVRGLSWQAVLHPKTEEEKKKAAESNLDFHIQTLITVCNAVSFAHSKGIAHCDLKPENVMLGEYGEVLVMDWGVAVDFHKTAQQDLRARCHTDICGPCGTPAYMPPELADGLGSEVGPGTDVFLLGAILHELITGQPPYQGRNFIGIIVKASLCEKPELAEEIDSELQEICFKALDRVPSSRYPSVDSFRKALEAYREHSQSRTIAQKAQKRLELCLSTQMSETHGGSKQTLEQQNELHSEFEKVMAGFAQGLELWDGNPIALSGIQEARYAYARTALKRGDLSLAQAQVPKLTMDEWKRKDLIKEIENFKDENKRRWFRGFRRLPVPYQVVLVVFLFLLTGALYLNGMNNFLVVSQLEQDKAKQDSEFKERYRGLIDDLEKKNQSLSRQLNKNTLEGHEQKILQRQIDKLQSEKAQAHSEINALKAKIEGLKKN
jgi:serine/threonine protein kinase